MVETEKSKANSSFLATGVPDIPGGMPSLHSNTGEEMSSGLQPSGTVQQETMMVTQGSIVETVTIDGTQSGQTVIVTVGGEMQTLTVGSYYPQMTGKCTIR